MTSQTLPETWRRAATALPDLRGCDVAPSADHLVGALAPGLQAAFGGCLAEALPPDLAGGLADLMARLDREPAPDSTPRR
jgi:hypothetical protein